MLGDVRLPPMKIQLSHTDPGLCIAWWNTGLAPPRGRRPVTDAHIDVAAGVLQHLIEDNGADLIALAEMSEDCAIPEAPACAQADPGTYLHHGGTCSRWRTFDQVIVSSAVLFGRSGWRLNEADTRVASVPQLDLGRPSAHRVFDHLPIVGHLERYFA